MLAAVAGEALTLSDPVIALNDALTILRRDARLAVDRVLRARMALAEDHDDPRLD
jgi:hypothetical protein